MGSLLKLPRRLAKLGSGLVSGFVFGNDIGIANNLEGLRLLRRCRRTYSVRSPSPQTNRLATALQKTGAVRLSDHYDPALLTHITEKLGAMFRDPRYSKPRDLAIIHGLPEATRNLRDPFRTLPELARLINPAVISLIEGYYGSHFRVVTAQVYRNAYVDPQSLAGRELYSNCWHFDRQHSAYLQLMVYLTEGVTRATGAYHTHDIASSKKIMRSGYINRTHIYGRAARMIDDPGLVQYFEGGAGDAMLTNNTLCLHRAGVPGPGTRRDVIMLHFEPSPTALPPNWPDFLVTVPGDDGLLMPPDRQLDNLGNDRFHPAVVAYHEEIARAAAHTPEPENLSTR